MGGYTQVEALLKAAEKVMAETDISHYGFKAKWGEIDESTGLTWRLAILGRLLGSVGMHNQSQNQNG